LFLRNNADGFFFESAGDPAERTFEDIADASKTEFKRWGVLRADVDDLGAVFSAGLSKPSLSRVSMLSFAFDHFFKGCVSTIVERMAPVAFVAYAGGDDLFIIAPWDDLVPLAQGLRNAFSDYVGSDKTVTFTAGAVIAPSKKYPISRLADAAEAEEKNGKSLPGKDALSFLDSVAHWADFKKIVADKDSLISAIGDSGRGNVPASRALLRQIIETHEEGSLQSIWRLMYQLARYADRMWRPPQRGERLMRLRELVVEQHELKPYIKCAARWAELTTRKER
jgi:CRISPR-associated protein Csm1